MSTKKQGENLIMENTQQNNAATSLTQCPECGKDISPRATTCPHCGKALGSPETAAPEAKKNTCSGKKSVFAIVASILAVIFLLTTIAAGALFLNEKKCSAQLLSCAVNLKQIGLEYAMAITDDKSSDPDFIRNPVNYLIVNSSLLPSVLKCPADSGNDAISYITLSTPGDAGDVIAMDRPGAHFGYTCMLLANGNTIIFPNFENSAEDILKRYYENTLGIPLTIQQQKQLEMAAQWDRDHQ